MHTCTGIQRWPRRQLLKMSKAMDRLDAAPGGVPGPDGTIPLAGPAGMRCRLSTLPAWTAPVTAGRSDAAYTPCRDRRTWKGMFCASLTLGYLAVFAGGGPGVGARDDRWLTLNQLIPTIQAADTDATTVITPAQV